MGLYKQVDDLPMDTDNDKMEIVDVEEKAFMKTVKAKILRHWRYNLPVILSVLSMVIVIIVITVAMVKIKQLEARIESTRPNQPAGGRAEALKNSLDKSAPLAQPGSTYVRWGRKTCRDGTELLYKGFGAAGSSNSERLSGGGVNYQCLPEEPEWNKYDLKNDSLAFSWMYAAEYISFSLGIFPDDAHGQNVPCSVCYAPRSAKVMIPARRTCPETWTKEYEGYLMTSMVTQNKQTYECIDQEPEYIAGMGNITGGALFYFSSGYCRGSGSFAHACPPYVHGRELTCVVCTK